MRGKKKAPSDGLWFEESFRSPRGNRGVLMTGTRFGERRKPVRVAVFELGSLFATERRTFENGHVSKAVSTPFKRRPFKSPFRRDSAAQVTLPSQSKCSQLFTANSACDTAIHDLPMVRQVYEVHIFHPVSNARVNTKTRKAADGCVQRISRAKEPPPPFIPFAEFTPTFSIIESMAAYAVRGYQLH